MQWMPLTLLYLDRYLGRRRAKDGLLFCAFFVAQCLSSFYYAFYMGMAVGLSPIIGQIITETDAVNLLGNVDCTIIGMGGMQIDLVRNTYLKDAFYLLMNVFSYSSENL